MSTLKAAKLWDAPHRSALPICQEGQRLCMLQVPSCLVLFQKEARPCKGVMCTWVSPCDMSGARPWCTPDDRDYRRKMKGTHLATEPQKPAVLKRQWRVLGQGKCRDIQRNPLWNHTAWPRGGGVSMPRLAGGDIQLALLAQVEPLTPL